MREQLIRQLEKLTPWNEQESVDRDVILNLLRQEPDIFERSCLTAHMTASAWVLDRNHCQVLMAYHNLYDSWAWLGGHADGEEDLLAVAIREVQEESGIQHVRALQQDIFSAEILTVDGHVKRGTYVPSHLHLNVTWLLEADDSERVRACEGENSAVAWFAPEDAIAASSEPWFRDHIYSKLRAKTEAFLTRV